MTSRAQNITLIVHGVILAGILVVVALLGWHGSIGEQATVGLLGSVLGLVGGSAGTLAVVGFNQPAPDKTPTPEPPA
jgi:uncharacterized membrane protein